MSHPHRGTSWGVGEKVVPNPKNAGEPNDPKSSEALRADEELDPDVAKWIAKAHLVADRALAESDFDLLQRYNKFLGGALQTIQLLRAFQNSPGMRVDGERGVKEQLGISHNAVYLRIEMVGLKAEDFRQPKATAGQLIQKSSILRPLLDEMLEN